MTRKPMAKCQGCEHPMWSKAGTATPKFCRTCRADGSKRARQVQGLSRAEVLAKARAAIRHDTAIRACDCGSTFEVRTPSTRIYCDGCQVARRRDHYRRKNRGRLGYAKAIRSFPITELGERDGWICWICSEPVDRLLSARHPLMPSYDHVVPSSRGGSDEPDNLRLAHLVCNIRRGNGEDPRWVTALSA